jgi:rubredoxin
MNKKKQKKVTQSPMYVCKTCIWGYGLHSLGQHTPMGPLDAFDGMPTIACPECGANYNDYGNRKKKKRT